MNLDESRAMLHQIRRLAKARRSAANRLPTDVEKTDKAGRKYWGPPDKKAGGKRGASKSETEMTRSWVDEHRRRLDEEGAKTHGIHRELGELAKMEKDPRRAAKMQRAAAAVKVVADAYLEAHQAAAQGDAEHADALTRWADGANSHLWDGEHRDYLQRAQRGIWGRHGRAARAASNVSPDEDARSQIERSVGQRPERKPKKAPEPSTTPTPLVHAAAPRVRRKAR